MYEKEDIQVLEPISHIIGNLYLGAFPNEISRFKYVFNFSGTPRYEIAIGQTVIVSPFDDIEVMPDILMLNDMADLIIKYSKEGPTLVHCAAGLNRSALVLGLALIRDGMNAEEAVTLMRIKRDRFVLCNHTFSSWLLSWD